MLHHKRDVNNPYKYLDAAPHFRSKIEVKMDKRNVGLISKRYSYADWMSLAGLLEVLQLPRLFQQLEVSWQMDGERMCHLVYVRETVFGPWKGWKDGISSGGTSRCAHPRVTRKLHVKPNQILETIETQY